MFTYTVIIPHYNSFNLLVRMLDSIPQRNDIQIIIVDDCSPIDVQNQLSILHRAGLEIVLLKENHGAGYARNIGLNKVQGKWLIVVDADDIFAPEAFKKFDQHISDSLDYICFCIKCVNGDLKPNDVKIVSDQSVRKYLSNPSKKTERYLKFKNTVCWNKLVSTNYIMRNSIRFEESEVNNDVLYAILVSAWTNRFKVIPDELYSFVVNPESITHKKRSIEREFLFYLQAQKRNGIFKILKYGYPFYRTDLLYVLFMIKKRGFADMVRFFKYRSQHIAEVKSAREAYLFLLEKYDQTNR